MRDSSGYRREWRWGGSSLYVGEGVELGTFSLCSQNSKAFGNSKLKPDLTGCYETISIQVGGYNMFYLTVYDLIYNF